MLIVVKIGGSTLKEHQDPPVPKTLRSAPPDVKIILVHGGGDEVTEIGSRMGIEQRFVVSPEGFRSRYTDKQTAELYTMVMSGRVNKHLAASFQSEGLPVVGLSGLDGMLLKAQRKKRLVIIDERGRKIVIEGGYTGAITDVNSGLLRLLLEHGYVPLIAPVAISEEFEPLNVDGDRAAAHIAGKIGADRLILLTDVKGLILGGKLIEKLTLSQVKETLSKVGHGMITKIYAATEAIELGVKAVVITSSLQPTLFNFALPAGEIGTVITRG